MELELIIPRFGVLWIDLDGKLVAVQRRLVLGQRISPDLLEPIVDTAMSKAELVVGLRRLGLDRQRSAELVEGTVQPRGSIFAVSLLVGSAMYIGIRQRVPGLRVIAIDLDRACRCLCDAFELRSLVTETAQCRCSIPTQEYECLG